MNRVIAVLFVAWSSAALAQPAGAQAEVLFRHGRDLLAAGKVAEACSAFEASQKLEPAVTTLINLAGCREKLGQLATAWGLFLDAVRQTRSAGDAASQQLHDLAQARADKLESRVSTLTINVPQLSQVDGLEIARDTVRIDTVMWNRALPIDGGTYTITAHAPGSNQWSTQVTVAAEGDTRTVEVPDLRNLPRDLARPATPPPPGGRGDVTTAVAPATARPATPPRPSSKLAPLLVGAGALALIGGGIGLELRAESTYDAAKSEMTSQPRRASLYSSANTKRYAAEAVAASGLAACGVAVWLYLRGDHREQRGRTDARLRVVPTASGLAIAGEL